MVPLLPLVANTAADGSCGSNTPITSGVSISSNGSIRNNGYVELMEVTEVIDGRSASHDES